MKKKMASVPNQRPKRPRCLARRCIAPAGFKIITFGRRGLPTWLCMHHREELERLLRAQARDWVKGRSTIDVRFFYAAQKGHHGY